MKTRQMTPFFPSIFYALFVTFNFIFENSQNSFWFRPPFGPFWSVKYLNFGQKLPIQTAHHTFLESGNPEVTKSPYYVLSPKESQKMESAHRLMPVCRGAYMGKNTYFCTVSLSQLLSYFISARYMILLW